MKKITMCDLKDICSGVCRKMGFSFGGNTENMHRAFRIVLKISGACGNRYDKDGFSTKINNELVELRLIATSGYKKVFAKFSRKVSEALFRRYGQSHFDAFFDLYGFFNDTGYVVLSDHDLFWDEGFNLDSFFDENAQITIMKMDVIQLTEAQIQGYYTDGDEFEDTNKLMKQLLEGQNSKMVFAENTSSLFQLLYSTMKSMSNDGIANIYKIDCYGKNLKVDESYFVFNRNEEPYILNIKKSLKAKHVQKIEATETALDNAETQMREIGVCFDVPYKNEQQLTSALIEHAFNRGQKITFSDVSGLQWTVILLFVKKIRLKWQYFQE